MKLKSIAGLFAALLFAFAVAACDSGGGGGDATVAPAAETPAALVESPAA